jgi:hypothetical protein
MSGTVRAAISCMKAAARWAGGLLAFALPTLVGTLYTLNYFYVDGAPMWDAGWFAYLASHSTGLTLPNPPAMGGSFYAVHVSPIFAALTFVHDVAWSGSDAAFFAATQGLWYGLTGLGVWLALGGGDGAVAVAVSVATALSGVALSTLEFPHIEIAIPALLILFIVLFRGRARWWACLPLLLLLTVREDAGLHAALLLGAIGVYLGREAGKPYLLLAVACTGVTVVAFVAQRWAFAGNAALSDTFLGDPPLHHLGFGLLATRVLGLLLNRSYLYVPVALMLLVARWHRSPLLALGPLACVPWTLLALVGVSDHAGALTSYYAFPFIAALAWPAVSLAIEPTAPRPTHMRLQALIAVLSIGLFAVSGNKADYRPWSHLAPLPSGRIAATEGALDVLLAHRASLGKIIVDDSVASLRAGAFSGSEIRNLLDFTDSEIAGTDALLSFGETSWLKSERAALISSAHLDWSYTIPDTSLILRSRNEVTDPALRALLTARQTY